MHIYVCMLSCYLNTQLAIVVDGDNPADTQVQDLEQEAS